MPDQSLEVVLRRIEADLNACIAEIKASLATIETRVTDLERRMHISPELIRELRKDNADASP